MANPEHLEILEKGPDAWNKWREDNEYVVPSLDKGYFKKKDLSGYNFSEANLIEANISGANLTNARLIEAKLIRVNLAESKLSRANFTIADLEGANLSGTELADTSFSMAYLRNSNFANASGIRTNFDSANLTNADFTKVKISMANFENACLDKTQFYDSSLLESNFSEAVLDKASLVMAKLNKSIFYDAIIKYAIFYDANLEDVIFTYSKITGATIVSCNMKNTDFKSARFSGVVIANTNLNYAKNLDSIFHISTSMIDFYTKYQSINLPNKFLKKCGLSDAFIDHIKYENSQIERYSCFISYSMTDEIFVDKLYNDLIDNGVSCYYATRNMMAGKQVLDQIKLAIRNTDKTLIVLSKASIKSNWVGLEIKEAKLKEKEAKCKRKLFPITLIKYDQLKRWKLFDHDTATDLAADVRSYYIPDFSDPDSYQEEFEKLLRALKEEPD